MPIHQTHPRRTKQHNHIPDLLKTRLPPLSRLVDFNHIIGDLTLVYRSFEEVGAQESRRDAVDADVVAAAFEGGLMGLSLVSPGTLGGLEFFGKFHSPSW
jgi:hypothetical protein